MTKKVLIFGIGKSNYNYKKIEGFINAFRNAGFDVKHYEQPPLQNELESLGIIDIIFSESHILYGDYSNVLNLVLWSNYKIEPIIQLAKKNPRLNIIVAPKSFIFNEDLNSRYMEKYGFMYQDVDHEGQHLEFFNELLGKAKQIDIDEYKLLDNLTITYLPCSLSEKQNVLSIKERKYKFSYFGTGGNRPTIRKALAFLQQIMPEKINFNFVENQVIHPERCIEFYKETEFVLHEQVQPVILEFPVRVGEATACGSKIILFEELNLYEEAVLTKKIPELIKFSSFEDFSQKIGSLSSSKEEAVKIVENFNFTYDNALQNILRLCNNRLFSERIK